MQVSTAKQAPVSGAPEPQVTTLSYVNGGHQAQLWFAALGKGYLLAGLHRP